MNADEDLEPMAYDAMGAPLYDHQISKSDFTSPETLSKTSAWYAGLTMTTQFCTTSDELIELLFGGPFIPLCSRKLPTMGQE